MFLGQVLPAPLRLKSPLQRQKDCLHQAVLLFAAVWRPFFYPLIEPAFICMKDLLARM